MDPIFFPTPADFRRWLEANHASAGELWVGYYKKSSGIPSITWEESVDQALCFGWIDGIRQGIDAVSFKNRFTPRRPGSNWSARNIGRVEALKAEGLMALAGLAAYEARKGGESDGYSYEQRPADLEEPYLGRLRANAAAWVFWQAQPPWYRRAAAWWVISAKKEETRLKRLEQLIADSAAGRTVPPLTRPGRGSV
jgi:uncharacterized protein YdeI (YjbR/CyaY-like superfamily)